MLHFYYRPPPKVNPCKMLNNQFYWMSDTQKQPTSEPLAPGPFATFFGSNNILFGHSQKHLMFQIIVYYLSQLTAEFQQDVHHILNCCLPCEKSLISQPIICRNIPIVTFYATFIMPNTRNETRKGH